MKGTSPRYWRVCGNRKGQGHLFPFNVPLSFIFLFSLASPFFVLTRLIFSTLLSLYFTLHSLVLPSLFLSSLCSFQSQMLGHIVFVTMIVQDRLKDGTRSGVTVCPTIHKSRWRFLINSGALELFCHQVKNVSGMGLLDVVCLRWFFNMLDRILVKWDL